jgi:quercetin dioxygenase-like cupin family protein
MATRAEKISGGQKRTPKQEPTINGSTYVRPQDMEWGETQFDKVWIKTLYEDRAKGESTVLIKLEPGAHLPFHKHPELEQAYVLEGSMYDHDGVCHAGEYVWRKAGSFHENRSDTGAVIFAVYRKQNIFLNGTGYSTKQRKS